MWSGPLSRPGCGLRFHEVIEKGGFVRFWQVYIMEVYRKSGGRPIFSGAGAIPGPATLRARVSNIALWERLSQQRGESEAGGLEKGTQNKAGRQDQETHLDHSQKDLPLDVLFAVCHGLDDFRATGLWVEIHQHTGMVSPPGYYCKSDGKRGSPGTALASYHDINSLIALQSLTARGNRCITTEAYRSTNAGGMKWERFPESLHPASF